MGTQANVLAQLGSDGISTGFKNRIINGAMVIDQRNAGASVTPTSNSYTLDRWQFPLSQASKLTVQQNAGSVPPPAGFNNYLGVTSSSAYSITSTDYFLIGYNLEGNNVADFGWGTANAKTVTLSFWVRSSLTGTFGGSVVNYGGATLSYPFSYSIASANTWTQVSVTIPGQTSGSWPTNNSGSITIFFSLGVGATYSGTAGAWASGAYYAPTGNTSVVGTNGATFYITGVQFEVGNTATDFEYRPYGTELVLCQRYYQVLSSGSMMAGTTNGTTQITNIGVPLSTPMRSTPTVGSNDYAAWYGASDGVGALGLTMTIASYSTNAATAGGALSGFSGLTDNRVACTRAGNALRLSAEL